MATTVTAAESDLHALVNLVEDARHDDPGEVVPWALLDGLLRLIRADAVQFTELDWVSECQSLRQYIDADDERHACSTRCVDEEVRIYFRVCRDFLPCGEPMVYDAWASRWSDFYTDLELADTKAVQEYFGHEVQRCLAVRLPSAPGRARRVMMTRGPGSDFSDRDTALLTLLRPHLSEIYLDAERRRAGVPKLTRREWEILALAGEGLPNDAIAQRLFISQGTVRKHMEHIFDHVGVRSRTQAAALALPYRPGSAVPH